MQIKFNEHGRSMVEILGVLVIIGILSIGGMAGYEYAYSSYQASQIQDAVSKAKLIAKQGGRKSRFSSVKKFVEETLGKYKSITGTDESHPLVIYENDEYTIFIYGVSNGICEKLVAKHEVFNSMGISVSPQECSGEDEDMFFTFNKTEFAPSSKHCPDKMVARRMLNEETGEYELQCVCRHANEYGADCTRCEAPRLWDTATNSCRCPEDEPYYADGKCQTCASVNSKFPLYNPELNKCVCDSSKGLYGDEETGCFPIACISHAEPFTAKGALTFCTEHDRSIRIDKLDKQLRVSFLDGWKGNHNYDYGLWGCRCTDYNTYNDAPNGGHYTEATMHEVPFSVYTIKYPVYLRLSGVGCDSGTYTIKSDGTWYGVGVCAGTGSTETTISYTFQSEIEGLRCPIENGTCDNSGKCIDGYFSKAQNICGLPGANENCKCPFGKKKIEGRCDWVCENGEVIQEDGTCACPTGTTKVNGWCRNAGCNEAQGWIFDTVQQKCVCNNEAAYYDNGKGGCTYCYGTSYGSNLGSYVWNFETKTCEVKCNQQSYTVASPYYSSKYPTGRWNAQTQSCECNSDIFFFGEYPNCKRCQSTGNMYDEATGSCICDLEQGYEKADGSCVLCTPTAKPNEDGTECICKDSRKVMFSRGECLSCDNVSEGLVLYKKDSCSTCSGWFTDSGNRCRQCSSWTAYASSKAECATCENRYWDNGTCRICPIGYFCSGGDRRKCSAGTYQASQGGGRCKTCSEGYYCPEGATTQTICPAGSYCPEGSGSATLCPAGTYQPSTGKSECISCSAGYYCPEGAKTQTVCPAGSYCPADSGSATLCPAGTYQPSTGKNECISCSAGYYCPEGAKTQTVCPAGSYCPEGSGVATPCSEGTYCPIQSSSETACQVGYYCSTPATQVVCPAGNYCPQGSSAPIACQAGTYRSETGGVAESDCTRCPIGSYQPETGKSECVPCSVGFYCPEGSTEQKVCPAGSYCTQGTGTPTACSSGSYCPIQSGTETACSGGYYCTTPTSQQICPEGYYCPSGSSSPITCPYDSYCPVGSSAPSAMIYPDIGEVGGL